LVPHLSKADRSAVISANEARRRKETALAELRELELRQRRGELIEAADAVREWSSACAMVRTRLLALPDRVAASLAGKAEAEIREALTSEITAALTALSAVK
jgi:hypothetical protein